MAEDHPFAQFLRIVGRGPRLSRSMTRDEARDAMAMILSGEVEPTQIGGFLLVLRTRGETAEEVAGFVDAARARISPPPNHPAIDLDWPSYADRHRQQPWFVLAARLLADAGVRILMHGIAGASDGYAPTRPALAGLGVTTAKSLDDVAIQFETEKFVYIGLESFAPELNELMNLRPTLGVRTVVNSLARALNPFCAPNQLQGVFHPPYQTLHADAARHLGQAKTFVFKGGGGECQRNPLKACRVTALDNEVIREMEWPALLPDETYTWRGEALEPKHIVRLWQDESDNLAAEAAVTGTVALALHMIGRASTPQEAQAMADEMWQSRSRDVPVATANVRQASA